MTALPGWYPDPENADPRVTRYWDGEQWTHHRKAPPGVFIPNPGQTTPSPKASRKRRLLLGTAVAVVVLVVGGIIALGVAGNHGSSTAGTLSASACSNVVDAGREAANGTRSMSSFLGVVKSQEGAARSASDINSRYLPITRAIVSVREDLESGRTPSALSTLINECGR